MKRGQNFALKFIFTGSTIHCRLKKPVVLDIVGLFKILSIYRLIDRASDRVRQKMGNSAAFSREIMRFF